MLRRQSRVKDDTPTQWPRPRRRTNREAKAVALGQCRSHSNVGQKNPELSPEGSWPQTKLDQATCFRFLRHHASRPPPTNIKPGKPAPTTGAGTAAAAVRRIIGNGDAPQIIFAKRVHRVGLSRFDLLPTRFLFDCRIVPLLHSEQSIACELASGGEREATGQRQLFRSTVEAIAHSERLFAARLYDHIEASTAGIRRSRDACRLHPDCGSQYG